MKKNYLLLFLNIFFISLITNISGYGFNEPQIVIIIVSDSQRADHMGCYGYNRDTTPYLSTDLYNWIIYEKHYSVASYSGPAYASIITGQWPKNHGTLHWEEIKKPTMIELFEKANFETIYVGQATPPYLNPFIERFDQKFIPEDQSVTNVTRDQFMTDKIISIIRNVKKNQRIFIFALYTTAHFPYDYVHTPFMDRPQKYAVYEDYSSKKLTIPDFRFKFPRLYDQTDIEYTIAIYDNQILMMDSFLYQIIANLKNNNLLKRSLIFFTADHGESLGEDNVYFWHGFSVNEGSIRVPLLIYDSGKHNRVSQITRHIDILPTIANRLRLGLINNIDGKDLFSLPKNAKLSAVAMSDYFQDQKPDDLDLSPLRFLGQKGRIFAVRQGQWKLVRRTRASGEFDYSLYNIENDPYENIDLSKQFPQILNALLYILSVNTELRPEQKLDPETLKYLRSLGYIR